MSYSQASQHIDIENEYFFLCHCSN